MAHPSWKSCTAAFTEFVAIRIRRPCSVCVMPVLIRAPLNAAHPVASSARLPRQLRIADSGCRVPGVTRRAVGRTQRVGRIDPVCRALKIGQDRSRQPNDASDWHQKLSQSF